MSKVRLIRQSERIVYEEGDSKFFYRRAQSDEIGLIRRKYTDSKNEIDHQFVNEILTKYLIGWEGIDDGTGKDLEFDAIHIPALPTPVKTELLSGISGSRSADKDISGEKLEKK